MAVYKSDGSTGWLQQPYAWEIERGDVRDYDSLHRAFIGVDAVIHLAALVGIPYSYLSPEAYYRTNVGGALNVLACARARDYSPRVIMISTSEVYGRARAKMMDEGHPITAASPYAATKIASDQLALSFQRSFELPICVARPFNVFGPRQSRRAVIPEIISQVLSGARELKLGNLKTRRDYTFVSDTVAALVRLLEIDDDDLPSEINIGTGKSWAIGDIARQVLNNMASEGCSIVEDIYRIRPIHSEVWSLCADASQMRGLGWEPKVDFVQGLQQTIEFIRAHHHLYRGEGYVV